MDQKKIFEDLLSVLTKDLSFLPDKEEEKPHNTLCALWHTATGNRVSPVLAEKLELPPLLPAQLETLQGLVRDRLSGVPLAHLTERQCFMGLDYIVNKGLYIPRKETELLAATAIATIAENFSFEKDVPVIDVCTGIGTVALAIAHFCGNTRVYGSDIYTPAIAAAQINARHFRLEKRASFFNADLFNPFESLPLKGKTFLVVSAPPYISSGKVKNMAPEIADHEPEEAFDAGPFGLSVINKLISISPEYLRADGYLMFECGLGQGEYFKKRVTADKCFGAVEGICDENGNIRVIKAKKVG